MQGNWSPHAINEYNRVMTDNTSSRAPDTPASGSAEHAFAAETAKPARKRGGLPVAFIIVLLIAIGLALITGGWVNVVIWLQTNVGVGEVSI